MPLNNNDERLPHYLAHVGSAEPSTLAALREEVQRRGEESDGILLIESGTLLQRTPWDESSVSASESTAGLYRTSAPED